MLAASRLTPLVSVLEGLRVRQANPEDDQIEPTLTIRPICEPISREIELVLRIGLILVLTVASYSVDVMGLRATMDAGSSPA